MMKFSAASTLVAASAAAAVIGLGAPAFASTGAVTHTAKPTWNCAGGGCAQGAFGQGAFGQGEFGQSEFGQGDFFHHGFRHGFRHRFFGQDDDFAFDDSFGPCLDGAGHVVVNVF